MKKNQKQLGILLSLFIILTCTGNVWANSTVADQRAAQSISQAIDYLHSIQNNDGGFPSKAGRSSSRDLTSWVIMALTAAGENCTGNNWAPSGQNPVDFIKGCEDPLKETTDYARLLLSLTAGGQEPVYNGVNLAEKIISFQQNSGQFAQPDRGEQDFINSHMWSILALASAGYNIPNQEQAKQWLLNQQNEDGGFGWIRGTASDSDDTGVALQALVLLGEVPESSAAINNALKYLKTCQIADGGFNCGDDWMGSKSNAASDSWVLQGLMAADEDPAGAGWSVNGMNPVSHLLSMQNRDGSFNFTSDTGSSPVTMTAYAIMALSKTPMPVNIYGTGQYTGGSSNKNKFSDLSVNYWAYDPIMKLVENQVLSGYPDGTFKPDNPVSRAEFTRFIVCGLNLQEEKISEMHHFPDMYETHWANKYVLIAADKGYFTGMPDGTFNPNGKISGAEMAAMMVRALPKEKVGLITPGPNWYSGYVTLAEANGLLYPDFQPAASASRAQCAYSIVQLSNYLARD